MAFEFMSSAVAPVFFYAAYSLVFVQTLELHPTHRYKIGPVLFAIAAASFWTAPNLRWPLGISSLWELGLILHFLYATSVLFIKQEVLASPRCGDQNISRTLRKYRIWQDPQGLYPRMCCTQAAHDNSHFARIKFSFERLLVLLGYWLGYRYVILRVFPNPFLPLSAEEFSASRQSIIRRFGFGDTSDPVECREILLRISFTGYWLYTTVTMLSGANVVLSLFFVALGPDEPERWPYVFGNPLEAYSVRRFWGKFWHRIAVPTYTCYTETLLQKLFRMKPGSTLYRTSTAFGIFTLSGISHFVCSWYTEPRCNPTGDLLFFWMNFITAAVEKVATQVLTPCRSHEPQSSRSTLTRALGNIWVLTFLCWLVPKWQYPKIYCELQKFDKS